MTDYKAFYNDKLINAIRDHPLLWNAKLKGYKNKEASAKSWEEVAAQLEKSVDEVKADWRVIRTSYTRIHKERNESAIEPDGVKKEPKWEHFAQMEFLRDFIQHRRSSSSIKVLIGKRKSPLVSSDADTAIDGASEDEDFEDASATKDLETPKTSKDSIDDSIASSDATSGRKNGQNRKIENTNEAAQTSHGKRRALQAEDGEGAFGRSVAATLRTMPTTQMKELAKMRIQQVLFEVQFPDFAARANRFDQ